MFLALLLIATTPQQLTPEGCQPYQDGDKERFAGTRWVNGDDYPPAARRAGEQGVTYFRLDIDAQGCPMRCHVTASSGSSILDQATCNLLMLRARFKPAEDAQGRPIASTYSNRVVWSLE